MYQSVLDGWYLRKGVISVFTQGLQSFTLQNGVSWDKTQPQNYRFIQYGITWSRTQHTLNINNDDFAIYFQ